jgi:hypothetical protein
LRARKSIGIHWGTFTTENGAKRTRADFDRWHVGAEDFELCDVGTWISIPK